MKDCFYSLGHLILTEEWHEFYLRNPARFIEYYLDIKLTFFQRMIITLLFWNRGKKKEECFDDKTIKQNLREAISAFCRLSINADDGVDDSWE